MTEPRPGVPVPSRQLREHWVHSEGLSAINLEIVAAQWGADEQLRLCVEWLKTGGIRTCCDLAEEMQAAMRPKPPSLKEQALETLAKLSRDGYPCNHQDDNDWATIRRALEALPDDD